MSRKNDKRVSRGGPQDDVLVPKNGEDMGAYTMQPLSGLMGVGGKDFIGPVAGGLGYTISTFIVNKVSGKLPDAISGAATRFAPVIGGVLGSILSGVALPFVAGSNKRYVVQASATSLTMGILTQVLRETGGLGVLVMKRVAGGPSMGALPSVTTGSRLPRQIKSQMDQGVYGRTWA